MRIPKVMLDAEPYRKELYEELENSSSRNKPYVDDDEDFADEDDLTESSGDLISLSEEKATTREATNYALMQLYEQAGYDTFKKVCADMRGNVGFDNKEYGFFKGEACEVYLYATINEFIKKFDLPWAVHSSLVIKHRDEKLEGGLTELDVVLVTQSAIVVFEAKSFNGKKVLTDKCTINQASGPKDLYKQNALHCESLWKLVKDDYRGQKNGFHSAFFWYANGTLTDNREEKYKRIMPAITEDNLVMYLSSIAKLTDKNWAVEIFGKVNHLTTLYTVADHKKFLGY